MHMSYTQYVGRAVIAKPLHLPRKLALSAMKECWVYQKIAGTFGGVLGSFHNRCAAFHRQLTVSLASLIKIDRDVVLPQLCGVQSWHSCGAFMKVAQNLLYVLYRCRLRFNSQVCLSHGTSSSLGSEQPSKDITVCQTTNWFQTKLWDLRKKIPQKVNGKQFRDFQIRYFFRAPAFFQLFQLHLGIGGSWSQKPPRSASTSLTSSCLADMSWRRCVRWQPFSKQLG